jgi:poly(A) polymerase
MNADFPDTLQPKEKLAPEIPLEELDVDARKVINRLQQHGHQAYLVGGCVRDLLLGRHPKDFDVATSAHPDEIRTIFRNCRLIGRRFRLAHIYFRGKVIEVSTFRAHPTDDLFQEAEGTTEGGETLSESNGTKDRGNIDNSGIESGAVEKGQGEADAELTGADLDDQRSEPVESRRDRNEQQDSDDVFITHDNVFGTAEQDARRRDFTINGLFYDIASGRVIDYVNGRRDLQDKLIRTIGNAERRMREDPVRILRAVRFAAKLGFDIESSTYAAMEGAVEDLPRCAPPRLLEETLRLIRSGSATESLRLLSALDALKLLLPPIAAFIASSKEREEAFYAHTRALDRRLLNGPKLDDAAILASMLLSLAEPEAIAELRQRNLSQAIDELLKGLVRNARLPRRVAEQIRLILLAQRTLSGERRRKGSLMSFRRHPLFAQALAVFEISVESTGSHREALEKWLSGAAPEVSVTQGRSRRRRRRGTRTNQSIKPSGSAPSAATE